MRNTLKVAKWEIKRNMKNKSFIIGLFLTPIIIALFIIIPGFFSDSEPEVFTVFVEDELNIIDDIKAIVLENEFLNWEINETDLAEEAVLDQLETAEDMAYFSLTEATLETGIVTVHMSDSLDESFINQIGFLEEPIRQLQLEKLGFSKEELEIISDGIAFESSKEYAEEQSPALISEADPLKRIVPGAFAGVILFSIVMSGMMIFQSASQEKKEKIAEIILSSVTPNELMQGKIIGYFVIGLVQVIAWIGLATPLILWKIDMSILEYLFVPELAILLLIAILGYLLFAAIFVGIGATIEDLSTSGNFQGMVLMLPFLPLIFLGPILNDPSGLIAQIGSYIPFTSPAVLIIRLSILEVWPWGQIMIAIAVLIVSVWLFMKLAGKIFKTGILMYGKNATPKEIWKWLWM